MQPRFTHILVPVDFSPGNRSALDVAFELSVDNKARVSLLHVIEAIDTGDEPDEELRAFYDRMETRAWTEMDALAQRFTQAGQAIDQKVRTGKRAHVISEFADEHNVDLIVMTSHTVDRRNPIQSLGTVSYKVSLLCSCSIMLVK
ncbi:MAG: universal stress protein [Planctomycetaceae bacterium]